MIFGRCGQFFKLIGTLLKLGIIGASTPFITGEPYMLFDKDHPQMAAGIVGLAAFSKSKKNVDVTIEHTSLKPLGQPMTITR